MAKKDRFERVYSQGTVTVTEVWVDKETGVNYLFHAGGYAGGLTPLLDREGKPVVSPLLMFLHAAHAVAPDADQKMGRHSGPCRRLRDHRRQTVF